MAAACVLLAGGGAVALVAEGVFDAGGGGRGESGEDGGEAGIVAASGVGGMKAGVAQALGLGDGVTAGGHGVERRG